MEYFEDAILFLLETLNDAANQFSELCRWMMIGICVCAMEGRPLEPGTNPDAGERLEALVASYQDGREADNAWPRFQKLCNLTHEITGVAHQRELDRVNTGRERDGLRKLELEDLDFTPDEVVKPAATEEQRAYVRRLIEDLREAGVFEIQRALKAERLFVRPLGPGILIDTLKPEIGVARLMVRVGVARMYFAHQSGDFDELVRALEDTLAIIRPIASQGAMIEHLVGLAARRMINEELGRELGERRIPLEQLKRIAGVLDGSSLPPIKLTLEVERQLGLDVIAQCYTDDGAGDGRLLIYRVNDLGGKNDSFFGRLVQRDPVNGLKALRYFMTKVKFPTKLEATERCDRFFRLSERWFQLNPMERKALDGNPCGIMDEAKEKYDFVAGVMLPSIDKMAGSEDRSKVWDTGTRMRVAMEVYKAERGVYPAALSDLVPGCLAAVPNDPMSPSAPLRYQRTDDGYLLYSVGADGADDGGATAPKPEDAFDPDKGRGFDLLLNRP